MIIVAILILILVFTAISRYIAYRLHQGLASFFPKIRFWHTLLSVSLITLFLVLIFLKSMLPFSNDVKYVLSWISGYCMGILLYLLLFTLLADVIFAVLRLFKLKFTRHRLFKGFMTLGVLSLTLLTCVLGAVNARQIDVASYDIRLQDKKDISDLNIVMLSDLHLGSIGSEGRLQNIVDEINSLKPDLVCIAGDFFDTDFTSIRNPSNAIKTLKKLNSTYGTYASLGNHDAGRSYEQMAEFLQKADITLLDDSHAIIDNRLVLVGRLDGSPIGGYKGQKRKDFSKVYNAKKTDLPVIVLDHNPKNIEKYNSDVDLILCGHTHKGQVFPCNLITNAIYEVDYGYYQKDKSSPQVIVSSGVGYWGMPFRVGSDSELVSIRFKP